jgi:predicted esterase
MLDERARRVRRAWGSLCVLAAFVVATFFVPPTARVHARAVSTSTAPSRETQATRTTRTTPRARASIEPTWIRGDASTSDVLVYPPREATSERAPVAVMLHGMCGAPESTCPWFAESVARTSWFVCPRGTYRCEGGGSGTMWSWKDNASFVDAAVKRVVAAHPGEVDDRANGTLIGFSWGALAALDVAQRGDGRWSSVILVAADVHPDAALLARAGVRRVYMGAGDGDMMKTPMTIAAQRLARQGIPSLFVGLGNVGHTFPLDMETWVAGAVAWTGGEEDAL